MKKTILPILYPLLILLLLLLPMALLNTEEGAVSELDNRVLAEYPDPDSKDRADGLERYLQDRIGLRAQMMTAYQKLNIWLTGELTHPNYSCGRDGYVFYRMHDPIEYGDFHRSFAQAVGKLAAYCADRGVPFYFLFEPEKSSVYRRYLPEGVNYDDSWVDELMEELNALGVRTIDNTQLLTEKSLHEQVFNRQYDAGHWNDLGCFYGTNQLWAAVHEDFPAVTEYLPEDFEIETELGRYLPASYFTVNEEVPLYTLKTPWDDVTERFGAVELHRDYPYFQDYINRGEGAGRYPRALIFQGSYYNRSPQFFVGRTSEYIGVHDYQNVLNLDYYFNLFQPDYVVLELAEYTVKDIYFDRAALRELSFNPALGDAEQTAAERIASAEAQAREEKPDCALNLVSLDGMDRVWLDHLFPGTRYAWLCTGDRIFDLLRDDDGSAHADLPQGAVRDGAELICALDDGSSLRAALTISKAEPLLGEGESTAGVSLNEEGQTVLRTRVRGNTFSSLKLQLYDADGEELLETLASAGEEGYCRGSFVHTRESGVYQIALKGNSNKQDEELRYHVYLTEGADYGYRFHLRSMENKKLLVSEIALYGPPSD